jgi:MarR family transcriptional regulator, 2-MHQ and catechol-resistance regulon repressor
LVIVNRRLTISLTWFQRKEEIACTRKRIDMLRRRGILLLVATMMASTSSTPSASPAALQQDARALQAAVADLVRIYQFRDRDRICCHDISVTQCHTLEVLVEHGTMRLGDLTERLFLDKSTTSRVVRTLVKKGYVEQHVDASDGRATAISATRAGRELYARITDELVEQQRDLLADLDPDIRARVVDLIRRLARAADSRFRSGVSVGATSCAAGECGPGGCR